MVDCHQGLPVVVLSIACASTRNECMPLTPAQFGVTVFIHREKEKKSVQLREEREDGGGGVGVKCRYKGGKWLKNCVLWLLVVMSNMD